jgi:hypothetical protein
MNARLEAEDSEPPEPEIPQVAVSSSLLERARTLLRAVREADDGVAAEVVSSLSGSQRLLAPLALAVGGIEMLFSGGRAGNPFRASEDPFWFPSAWQSSR